MSKRNPTCGDVAVAIEKRRAREHTALMRAIWNAQKVAVKARGGGSAKA